MWDDPEMKFAGVTAYFQVSDAKAAAELYKNAFAGKEIDRRPTEDGRLMHCHFEINGGAFMFSDAFPEYGMALKPIQGVTAMIASKSIREWWDRAAAAGLEIVSPIKVEFWGDLFGTMRDPFGIEWGFVGPDDGKSAAAA